MPNDYILRSDALKVLCDKCVFESHCSRKNEFCDQIQGIKAIHAADAEPMRCGQWIQTKDGDFACSLCGYIVKGEPMNYPPDGQMMLRMKGHHYCGDCGAKMMGEQDDGRVSFLQ